MTDGRELLAVREIAHAFLVADHPSDVQQFALSRVTPLLGASFSMVMQLGADGELLRPVAQHEWPAAHRAWIGALRVRVGDGPSGLAVAERRLVEVEDLFADAALGGWHEVAQELGFRSIIAAPLETPDGPIGAVAFYFADATSISDEQRALVRLVADQLAAATDKARRVDAFRRANAALAEANAELEAQAAAWSTADFQRRQIERIVVEALLNLTVSTTISNGEPVVEAHATQRLASVRSLALVAQEFTAVTDPAMAAGASDLQDVDLREAVQMAVAHWRRIAPRIALRVSEPTVLLPTLRMRTGAVQRVLELVLGIGMLGAAVEQGEVRVAIDRDRAHCPSWWSGTDVDSARQDQPLQAPSRILQLCGEAFSWRRTIRTRRGQSVTAADLRWCRHWCRSSAVISVSMTGATLRRRSRSWWCSVLSDPS